MKKTRRQSSISSFSALVSFGLFALCVLCVLFSAAGVYSRLTQRGEESYARRTGAQYVSTRVRQGGAVRVESFDTVEALVLCEQVEGEEYLTRVYCYEGWLMELFSHRDAELFPADGEKLIPMRSFSPALEKDLLHVELWDEFGVQTQLVYHLGEQEVPK